MKIGIYSPYLNTLGGGERYMLSIAEHLSQEHFVDIFWDDKLIKEKAQSRLALDITRTNIVDNIFSKKISPIAKVQKTRTYDALIFLSDGSIPLSLAKHTIIHFQRPFPAIKGKNIGTKIKLKGKTTIVVNSKFTKKWIDKSFGISSKVVYPPVAIEHFKPKDKKHTILSVGRFHEFKKQDVLLSTFQNNKSKFDDWKLIIAGGLMDQDQAYFDRLKSHVVSDRVLVKPNISYKELVNLYGQSSIYWHAAGFDENERTNPEAMEHFGITSVEAMASGCIVFAYDGGGQREIITDGENGYLWKSKEELVSKTQKVIQSSDKAKSIMAKAIEATHIYSRKHFNEQIEKIINL